MKFVCANLISQIYAPRRHEKFSQTQFQCGNIFVYSSSFSFSLHKTFEKYPEDKSLKCCHPDVTHTDDAANIFCHG